MVPPPRKLPVSECLVDSKRVRIGFPIPPTVLEISTMYRQVSSPKICDGIVSRRANY